ncbi:MAG: hypothetical protein AAFQ76_18415, partial [Cyanobacteria bacterium J06626_26]
QSRKQALIVESLGRKNHYTEFMAILLSPLWWQDVQPSVLSPQLYRQPQRLKPGHALRMNLIKNHP